MTGGGRIAAFDYGDAAIRDDRGAFLKVRPWMAGVDFTRSACQQLPWRCRVQRSWTNALIPPGPDARTKSAPARGRRR